MLRLVDARLTRPGTIRLIGGAVVGLCHLPSYRTRDIDYAWADREVLAALAELRAERPDLVVTEQTGVYFAPYAHAARLRVSWRLPRRLHKFTGQLVFVASAHAGGRTVTTRLDPRNDGRSDSPGCHNAP